MNPLLCDASILGALCIARYVFHIPCFEWYVPACVTSFLEPADLPEGNHRLVTDEVLTSR